MVMDRKFCENSDPGLAFMVFVELQEDVLFVNTSSSWRYTVLRCAENGLATTLI